MKVLLTATVQSHIGQFHQPHIRMLRAHGCEVHVAAYNNLATKDGLRLENVERVFDLPFSRSPFSRRNWQAYRQLKKILAEEHYDVIQCNTPVGGIVTRLAARNARKHGTRVIYTAHGFHFYHGAPLKNWLIYYPIERFFARTMTDLLVTITSEDEALAEKKFHCPVARIHGVGADSIHFYPVDGTEKQRVRAALSLDPTAEYILCVGELLPNKNQQMAIRMMEKLVKSHPRAILLLAGDGTQMNRLSALTDQLGLQKHVRFLHYTRELPAYLQASDLSVACSYREGLPQNVMEAMLTRVPVVATDNRGHRELIADKHSGYLVPINDSTAMCDCVRRLLEQADKREAVTQEAYTAVQKYAASVVFGEWEDIYFGAK